jgi:hypothetical protein
MNDSLMSASGPKYLSYRAVCDDHVSVYRRYCNKHVERLDNEFEECG